LRRVAARPREREPDALAGRRGSGRQQAHRRLPQSRQRRQRVWRSRRRTVEGIEMRTFWRISGPRTTREPDFGGRLLGPRDRSVVRAAVRVCGCKAKAPACFPEGVPLSRTSSALASVLASPRRFWFRTNLGSAAPSRHDPSVRWRQRPRRRRAPHHGSGRASASRSHLARTRNVAEALATLEGCLRRKRWPAKRELTARSGSGTTRRRDASAGSVADLCRRAIVRPEGWGDHAT
jgi:hypothetical protein